MTSLLVRLISFLVLPLIFLLNCSEQSTNLSADDFAFVETPEDTTVIYIVDRTGKRWDVTHAVNNYGFDPKQFQYGLGPFAIEPILNPEMIGPGNPGYPSSDDNFLVIGTTLESETRAYQLNVLAVHEIVDEKFKSTHVAVAY
jgi:hypothetical protein